MHSDFRPATSGIWTGRRGSIGFRRTRRAMEFLNGMRAAGCPEHLFTSLIALVHPPAVKRWVNCPKFLRAGILDGDRPREVRLTHPPFPGLLFSFRVRMISFLVVFLSVFLALPPRLHDVSPGSAIASTKIYFLARLSISRILVLRLCLCRSVSLSSLSSLPSIPKCTIHHLLCVV